jgi:integrase
VDATLIEVLLDRRAILRLKAGILNGAPVDLSLVRFPDGALIFPGGDGTNLTRLRSLQGIGNDFRERARKLGFRGLRLHDLRGSHATLLLDAGVPVHVVAARIGDDPATLLRWYAKRTKKADTSAAGILGALSRSILGTP